MMVDVTDSLAGKRVLVVGLGRFGGGIGAVRWLCGQGARVCVTDLADEGVLADSVGALADCDVRYRLGGHDVGDLDGVDLVVVSPAVDKRRSDFFQEIERRGIAWTTEVNLFLERCPGRVVGVTGSFGKSTTAAMIGHVLAEAWMGGAVYLGGNIGRSLLGELGRMTRDDVVVMELSSFQLEDLVRVDRQVELSVVVNVERHHLERHGTFEVYRDCKLNIVRGGRVGMPVVLGAADGVLRELIEDLGGLVVDATVSRRVGVLVVPGEHNRVNARCAAEVCSLLGMGDAVIAAGLSTFLGLAHRLQFVGEFGGVRYFNDSKATSLLATMTAIRAFDEPVVLLMGGKSGEGNLRGFFDRAQKRIKSVIAFGEIGGDVVEAAMGCCMVIDRVDGVEEAVGAARRRACCGDVVLFSPGFPSYDGFVNYEARGDAFVRAVRMLCAKG